MAVTYHFPVAVWKNQNALYSAVLLEWDEPPGIGETAGEAMQQIREFMEWYYTEHGWLSEPDFLDPHTVLLKVPVRPEYVEGGRRYPCDEAVTLRVACVHARQETGLLVAVLPTFGLRFYYHDPATLKNLVTHYVQQHLEALTPAQIARYLAPVDVRVDDIVLTLPRRKIADKQWRPRLRSLETVAEPIGDPVFRKQFVRPWERDKEVADLQRRAGKDRVNVLLIGESGSGKTTILVEAVRQLERERDDTDDDPGSPRKFWLTSASRLIAGMKYLGQWEERCEEVVVELQRAGGGVLCIENLLDLIREGGTSPLDSVGNFFLPYLQRGELRMIAEVTPAELDACRRLLPGLADCFQVMPVVPMTREQAVNVLDQMASMLKQNLHIEVERGVVDLVYHLFRRFLPYQAFPGRASAFLGLIFERARQLRSPNRRDTFEVTMQMVVDQFVKQTGLPELFLRDQLTLRREEVLSFFRPLIIGQEEACEAATDLVMSFKAGMNDPFRPVGVLLFCGPTGVGKTEMARTIARYFFGHGDRADRLMRLDMSEYNGPGAAERLLIQANRQPSKLIQTIRQQPFVVLLLDEIEKADPEVFDVLMGVFDEGRLTDPYGRLTNFRSTIIVLTSNLGAGKQAAFGFSDKPNLSYEREAMGFFRPEFFNRLDGIVTFQPLSMETIRAITRKELAEIAGREGVARNGMTIEWGDPLVEHLAKVGFDPRFGARPLQRKIEEVVVTPLARFLLEHHDLEQFTLRIDLTAGGNVNITI